ncbi:MAG: DUF3068 domain-containing protein [Actinobacteria bacterium]|nr:DUF3068 domain-containing protein [Actinomycetota bacterium]
MKKTGPFIALGLGVLLIVAGLIVKFVVVPALAVFPDDVDSTRTYEGTLEVMLNADALATGDMANIFMENIPINLSRHVTTEETDGGKALVHEVATMTAADGTPLPLGSEDWYTIDRKTMEHIPNFTDNPDVIDARQGLVVGFPIGTEKKTYDGWSDYFQKVVPLEFVAEEERAGWDLYHFRAQSAIAPITDPATLAMFPAGLPLATVTALAPSLAPEDMLPMLGQILPALPDPVPFTYLYEYETNYWVDPATGVLIDYTKDEAIVLAIMADAIPGGIAPVGPVLGLVYQHTDDAIADAKVDAEDGQSLLNLFGVIVPYLAIGLGAVLALGGGFFAFRKEDEAAAAA